MLEEGSPAQMIMVGIPEHVDAEGRLGVKPVYIAIASSLMLWESRNIRTEETNKPRDPTLMILKGWIHMMGK